MHRILLLVLTLQMVSCQKSKLNKTTDNGVTTLSLNQQSFHTTTKQITEEAIIIDENQTTVAIWKEPHQTHYAIWNSNTKTPVIKKKGAGPSLKRPKVPYLPSFTDTLFLVEFETQILKIYRKKLIDAGITILQYLPHDTLVVDRNSTDINKLRRQKFIKNVEPFHYSYKIDSRIPFQSPAFKHSKDHYLVAYFGNPQPKQSERHFLTGPQLIEKAKERQVSWIEYFEDIEEDMNLARIQGGAHFLESVSADPTIPEYTGIGIVGHVLEGINKLHPDFRSNDYRDAPIGVSNDEVSYHGQATFGIVFGSGSGNPRARGLLPNGQGIYTNANYINRLPYPPRKQDQPRGNRFELTQRVMQEEYVMFQTASWGTGRTISYSLKSAELDRLILELDIPITQSQSNSGNQLSRPEAWAKNVISVGGVRHGDTLSKSDDSWVKGGSIGPAQDGRIKPDLVAYFDSIETTNLKGYRQFGGTSGATPIVAGYLGLSIELWTNGVFGNDIEWGVHRFYNRPHSATSKALLINSASQYDFEGQDHDLTRVHQGWGFPDVKALYKRRNNIFVINQDHILENLESQEYIYTVPEGRKKLQATLVYNDPPGNLSSNIHRINNLDLRVVSPEGIQYWGNNGLLESPFSEPGGTANKIDTVENVIIENPSAGPWTIMVIADEVNEDSHLETEATDASYGLVVSHTVPF